MFFELLVGEIATLAIVFGAFKLISLGGYFIKNHSRAKYVAAYKIRKILPVSRFNNRPLPPPLIRK